jgi:hypothetical protein
MGETRRANGVLVGKHLGRGDLESRFDFDIISAV